MDTRKLHYFYEVAIAGSFTKAAEKLHIAQPAITKTIQKLEEELSLTLFDRSEKSAILTPEGNVLYHHAKAILSKLAEAEKEMEELVGLHSGDIRIGLPSMFAITHFPQIIKQFRKQYPLLHINVMEEGTVQIRHLVENKQVDMGIISATTASPDLDISPLVSEELFVCCHPDHPFAKRSSIKLEEIFTEPLILFREGYHQRKLVEDAAKAAGITPNIIFSTNQLSLIRSLVLEGLGITLFLDMVVTPDPQLCAIPLDPPVRVHLGVGRRRDTYLSIASQAFLAFLIEYYQPSQQTEAKEGLA